MQQIGFDGTEPTPDYYCSLHKFAGIWMQNFFYLHIWIFIWNIDRIKLKYQSGYISLFSQSIKICKIVLVMLWHAVLTFKKGRLKLCSVVIILVILLQIWWYWYYCCCYYGYRLGCCCWWLAVKGNISYVVVGETFKICIIELLPPLSRSTWPLERSGA